MFLPSSARAPAVLLAIGLLVLIGMLCFDASDMFHGGSQFVALRADLRVLSSVLSLIGAIWLAAVMQHDRARQYTDARVTFAAAQVERVLREATSRPVDEDTVVIPRLRVVRGTAAVVSPLETIDPNTVRLLRRLDNELRGDDQQ